MLPDSTPFPDERHRTIARRHFGAPADRNGDRASSPLDRRERIGLPEVAHQKCRFWAAEIVIVGVAHNPHVAAKLTPNRVAGKDKPRIGGGDRPHLRQRQYAGIEFIAIEDTGEGVIIVTPAAAIRRGLAVGGGC
jgi:hypothetical protein